MVMRPPGIAKSKLLFQAELPVRQGAQDYRLAGQSTSPAVSFPSFLPSLRAANTKFMRVLGIETSCDETGIAIYDSEQGLLGDALYSQVEMHARYGG